MATGGGHHRTVDREFGKAWSDGLEFVGQGALGDLVGDQFDLALSGLDAQVGGLGETPTQARSFAFCASNSASLMTPRSWSEASFSSTRDRDQ